MINIKNFFKDLRAGTAVEFAIIAPLFFLLFIGIIEVGLTMFFESSINTGLRAAARAGVTQYQPDGTQINSIMNANLGGLYKTSSSRVVIKTYADLDDANLTADRTAFLANPDSFFSGSTPGTIVMPSSANQNGTIMIYGIKYSWGGITGIMRPFIPANIYSFTIVRNEPLTIPIAPGP